MEITENIITSVVILDRNDVDITQVRPDVGDRVKVLYTWKLEDGHGYGDGATYTFSLPDQFGLSSELDGDLDGDYGTYVVTPDGKITFTFNDSIENQEVQGDFFVWREFDESKLSGGTKQPIEFKTPGEIITVHFKSKSNEEMSKRGTANKGKNPSEIDWVVDFNKGELKIDGATFTDPIPTGLELDPASVKVYKLDVMLNGNVVQGAEYTSFTPPSAVRPLEIDFGNIEEAYRVVYKTKITEANDTTYRNTATLTGGSYTNSASSSVAVSFSQPLGKKVLGYDDNNQTITWSIEYNYNEQAIPANLALIKDSFSTTQTQEFIQSTLKVYKVAIDDNGNATRLGEEVDIPYTVTPDSSGGFELKFNDNINAAYQIVYQTRAKERVHSSVNVTNQVEMHDGTTESVSQQMHQRIFWKTADNREIDYNAKTILWRMHLNYDKYRMTDVVITDTYAGQDLELIKESLSISGLSEGTHYTVDPITDYTQGFTITFLKDVEGQHVIEYKTRFNPNFFNANDIENHGELEWYENGTRYEKTSSAKVVADSYTKKNGNKTGSYNATTKRITWTIDVNYNLNGVADPVVTDFYSTGQTLLQGTLKVYPLTLKGGADEVDIGGAEFTNYTFVETTNSEGRQGFKLTFNESISGPYRIIYETSLEGEDVLLEGYWNEATLRDGEGGSPLFTQSVLVTPKYGGEYVFKEGRQGTGANAEFMYWTIYLNRSQSYIPALEIATDELSDNQLLINDSFKLYEGVVNAAGDVSKGQLVDPQEYTLEIGQDGHSFALTFLHAIEKPYILEYTSFINAGDGERVDNKASFAGKTHSAVGADGQIGIQVRLAGAGGGAYPSGKAVLRIVKVDAQDSQIGLAGAVFKLQRKNGQTYEDVAGYTDLVTNSIGKLYIADLAPGDYQVVETQAPRGYKLDQAAPIPFTILANQTQPVEWTAPNDPYYGSVTIVKVDEYDNSITLSGAVFELQDADGNVKPGYEHLTTDAAGVLELQNLKAGKYQLVERTAPAGYLLSQKPLEFEIVDDQAVAPLLFPNKMIPGSVELTKTETGRPDVTLSGWMRTKLQSGAVPPMQTASCSWTT